MYFRFRPSRRFGACYLLKMLQKDNMITQVHMYWSREAEKLLTFGWQTDRQQTDGLQQSRRRNIALQPAKKNCLNKPGLIQMKWVRKTNINSFEKEKLCFQLSNDPLRHVTVLTYVEIYDMNIFRLMSWRISLELHTSHMYYKYDPRASSVVFMHTCIRIYSFGHLDFITKFSQDLPQKGDKLGLYTLFVYLNCKNICTTYISSVSFSNFHFCGHWK